VEAIADAASVAAEDLDVVESVHGTAAYRRHVARVLVRRAVTLATDRARRAGA
jgi:carbon-monoxide dehydrogenase medium subunit